MSKTTTMTTLEEAIDFFVKLTEAALTEPPSEADRETLRAQAAQVVDGFQSLALAFRIWSEAPGSLCPNHLTQTFLVSNPDGSDDGSVEIVLRRVRLGGESFASLLADAVRAKAIRAAGADWRASLVAHEPVPHEPDSEKTSALGSMCPEEGALDAHRFAKEMAAIAENARGDEWGLDLAADAVAKAADQLSSELMNFHILRDK